MAAGADVPLQRVQLHIAEGDIASAIQFVVRSEDGTRWWRDSSGDFRVPLPGKKWVACYSFAVPALY